MSQLDQDPPAPDPETIQRRLYDYGVADLEGLIRRANVEYWDQQRPTLPDELYDRLVERLRALAPGSPVLEDLGDAEQAERSKRNQDTEGGPEEVRRRLRKYSADELESLIRRANTEYWEIYAPTLPDELYDQLVERLRNLRPESPLLEMLGEERTRTRVLTLSEAEALAPEQRFGTAVQHQRPMLSLEKCYSLGERRKKGTRRDRSDGEKKTKTFYDWASDLADDVLLAMPKLDGIAASLRYDSRGTLWLAATRGSGTIGDDITANALEISGVRRDIGVANVELRGEIFMPLSVFADFKDKFANPRNLAAGAIKQKDRTKSRAYKLHFVAYDILGTTSETEVEKFALMESLNLSVAPHNFIRADSAGAIFKEISLLRPHIDYETDGVVFRINSVAEQERLGNTSHHPRYAIAWKFQGDSGETVLEDVLWSVSRSGTITPVAMLRPIELSGAMISRAGLHNLSLFRGLHVTRGATVEVTRRGGVIPYVERVVAPGPGEEPFPVPDRCPSCGGPVSVRRKHDKEFLQCENPRGCVHTRLGELGHFVHVVDIQGFGPKVIAQLLDAGLVTTPADFFRLKAGDLTALERLGDKSAQNLIDQVEANREIPLGTFLEALGIEHLGAQASSHLARTLRSLDAVRALDETTLGGLYDSSGREFKESRAGAIVAGLRAKAEVIDDLLTQVTIGAPEELPEAIDGPLSGKSFVFTGALESFDRKHAQERVRALGGETPDGVSKHLTHLVVGAGKGAKSSKQKKAEKLIAEGAEIAILGEAEFLAMLEGLKAE